MDSDDKKERAIWNLNDRRRCAICGEDGYMATKPIDWEKYKGNKDMMVEFYTLPEGIQAKMRQSGRGGNILDGQTVCGDCYAQFEYEKWKDDYMICKECKKPLSELGQPEGLGYRLWGCPKCGRVYYESAHPWTSRRNY